MLKRILIPLDESSYTLSAVEKGVRMAKATGAKLMGLGIVDEPGITKPEAAPPGAGDFLEKKQERKLEEAQSKVGDILEDFQSKCRAAGVEFELLKKTGAPGEIIIHESLHHDLIVMGRENNYKFITQDSPCGSVDMVLKARTRPTLIVPEELPTEGKGVMVATDGSHGALRAIQMYQLMGLVAGREVHVVSVNKDQAKAQTNVNVVDNYLKAHNIQTKLNPIESNSKAWDVMLKIFEENPPQVLVMGAFGKSGLREFLLGSVTNELLHNSPVPLFIYH